MRFSDFGTLTFERLAGVIPISRRQARYWLNSAADALPPRTRDSRWAVRARICPSALVRGYGTDAAMPCQHFLALTPSQSGGGPRSPVGFGSSARPARRDGLWRKAPEASSSEVGLRGLLIVVRNCPRCWQKVGFPNVILGKHAFGGIYGRKVCRPDILHFG